MNNQRDFVNTIFYFCFTLAILNPAAASAAEEKMTAAEIRELLTSNTLSGKNERQRQVHVYHDPSGIMEGMSRGKGMHYDTGNWTTTDEGQYCQQWDRWYTRALICFHIYRLGDNKFHLKSTSGAHDTRFSVREGNPEGLKLN